MEVLVLLFLVLLLLALDRQDAIRDLDLDVLLVEPGQLGGQLESILLLDQVDGRRRDPGLRLPERLDIERRPAERQLERVHGEVLEQPVNFAPKALKRPPRLHSGWRSCGFAFRGDGHFLNFRHSTLHFWAELSALDFRVVTFARSALTRRKPPETASPLSDDFVMPEAERAPPPPARSCLCERGPGRRSAFQAGQGEAATPQRDTTSRRGGSRRRPELRTFCAQSPEFPRLSAVPPSCNAAHCGASQGGH